MGRNWVSWLMGFPIWEWPDQVKRVFKENRLQIFP